MHLTLQIIFMKDQYFHIWMIYGYGNRRCKKISKEILSRPIHLKYAIQDKETVGKSRIRARGKSEHSADTGA